MGRYKVSVKQNLTVLKNLPFILATEAHYWFTICTHVHYVPACLVTQSCMTLHDPLDCSPPGSSVHEINQARIPEWVAMPSSRESSWPRNRTRISCVFCIVYGFFSHWAIKEAPSPVHHLFKCQHSLPVNSYYSNARTGTGNLYNAHYEGLIKTGINWHFKLDVL